MGIIVFLMTLILAQGNGFVVKPPQLVPYWQAYTKMYGAPRSVQEKREILMNYLGDYLLYRQAVDLKLDRDKTFIRSWQEAKKEVQRRCKQEQMSQEACKKILSKVKRTLLIALLVDRKVLPRIRITEEEIQQMVSAHENKKHGKKLTRENVILFLKKSRQAAALSGYINELMRHYKVTINEKALGRLKLPAPSS